MTLTKYKDLQELFSGCVAYWDGSLTNDGKLCDLIGGNHGTITGATKTGTDRLNQSNKSLVFDGVDDMVEIGSGISTFNLSTFTFIVWAKRDNSSGLQEIFSNNYGSWGTGNSGNSGYALVIYDGGNIQFFYITTSYTYSITYCPSININEWHMVSFTINASDSNRTSIYVDGALINSQTNALNIRHLSSGRTNIGRVWSFATGAYHYPFDGSLGETLFFNRALSTNEIKIMYDLTSKNYIYPLLPGSRCSL